MTNQPVTTAPRNRIQEVKRLRFGDVAPNPNNPKYHPPAQREAFRGSVNELGFGTVPIAYYSQRLGGKLAWGDGHMRGAELADYVGEVAITDYDDDEIDKFLLYADPIAAMAQYEAQTLASLRQNVVTPDPALLAMLGKLLEEHGPAGGFDPGHAPATGADQNGASGAASAPGADDESHVRMVHLFFDAERIDDFSRMTRALADRYGTDTVTDTVFEAISREYHSGDETL